MANSGSFEVQESSTPDFAAPTTQVVGELNGGRSNGGYGYRSHGAHGPRGNHTSNQEAGTAATARESKQADGFGAGIFS